MINYLRVLLLGLVFLAACSKEVSQSDYNKVSNNMSFADVVKILGRPKDQKSITIGKASATTASWGSKDNQIVIQFVNDKVILKNYLGHHGQAKNSK